MLTDNAGYLKFASVVNHILLTGDPTPVFEDWCAHRWSQVSEELNGLCQNRSTDAFVHEYADTLVEDLLRLLQINAESAREAAPINAAETLLAQARLYAETEAREPAPAPTPDPLLPEILEHEANHDLAIAA